MKNTYYGIEKLAASEKGKDFALKSATRAGVAGLVGGITSGILFKKPKMIVRGAMAGSIGSGVRDLVAPKKLFYKAD